MMHLDSVQIGVPNLTAAVHDYRVLLGVEPVGRSDGRQRFQLQSGAVELLAGPAETYALRFVPAAGAVADWPVEPATFNGLQVRVASTKFAPAPVTSADGVQGIDHVVVHSPDLPRALALWRDRLGVRLALDREFPARGLRMLFFRSGGMTLEFVGTLTPPADTGGPDRIGGIAYGVASLDGCRTRLVRAGVDVSEIRRGQKAGTLVATVRSGSAGVPTLLIEHPAGTGRD